MTAFSSILGFVPLVIASGAGAGSRQAVGTAVVGGMIAATFFSLMFVPAFFVVFQGLGEFFGGAKTQPDKKDAPAPPPSEPPEVVEDDAADEPDAVDETEQTRPEKNDDVS